MSINYEKDISYSKKFFFSFRPMREQTAKHQHAQNVHYNGYVMSNSMLCVLFSLFVPFALVTPQFSICFN